MDISLTELDTRSTGYVKRIEGGYGFQKRMSSLGIRVGKPIRKITAQLFGGPIIVEVNGCQIALGQGMARKIVVEVNG